MTTIATDRLPSSWGGPQRDPFASPGYLNRIAEQGYVPPSTYSWEKRRASGKAPWQTPLRRGRK